ncbi:MAG TPA: GGDEF domain-containing protein [Terracidiphilus sp.]|nr:GGDEF domain-containing protein [Terracidiphilus sp.]
MVGLTVAQVAASALLPPSLALTAISDSLYVLLLLGLCIAFAGNATPARGRVRAFWVIQAVGWSISLVNQVWWMFYDVILQKPVPVLFAGDVFVFLPGVFLLAGFLLRPHLQQSKRSTRLGMLDFLLLMLWWVCFYAYLVTCWQYVSPNAAFYSQNYDRLYMVENLVLVVVLGFLIKQSAGPWRRLYVLFLAGVFGNYVFFWLENHAIETNAYFSGIWLDSPYLASFALFMVVAMRGRGLGPIPDTTEHERFGSWMAGLAILAVLSLPVIALAAVLESGVPPEVVHFRVLVTAVAMLAMAGLVFMKQHLLHEELKQANRVLEESSTTDPLTGIRNRRFLSTIIQGDVARSLRAYADGSDPLTRDLIFYVVDLDNFKKVNDLHGHDAGDLVLVESARRISSAIRNSDVLVRWGGEEFLIISRYTDRRQAGILADRVMEAVRGKPFVVGSTDEVHQTCSIGWAVFPWLQDNVDAMGYEQVLKFADRALYRAKRAGKDRAIGMAPMREGTDLAGADESDASSPGIRSAKPMGLDQAGMLPKGSY